MNKGYDNMSKMSVRNSVNDSTMLDDIVEIVGIPINRISSEDVTNTLVKWALGQQPHHVVTVNPEFVMIARENKEFLQVLKMD